MRRPGHRASNAGGGPVVTLLAFPLQESGGIAAFVRSLLAALGGEYDAAFPVLAPAESAAAQSTRYGQMSFAATVLRELFLVQPRVIQNHENLPLLCAAVTWKLLTLGSVRVIHTVHVDPAERKHWVKRALIGGLYALCDRVVVVSEDTRRRLANTALQLRRNVEVIYGAPPPTHSPLPEAVAAFAASFGVGPGPVVCQITRFYYPLKVKGAELLLAAFRLVRREVPDAQFLLVGHGPLWEEFRDTHGLQTVTDGVTLTGFVDNPLLPMTLANVYCHISFQDALPIVVMEAMSLGKAVVASAVGGVPEIIEDGVSGVLTDSDAGSLARTLIRLLQAPEQTAELGREAKRQINARLSWSKCAAHYAALYGVTSNLEQRRASTETIQAASI